jgi:predicted  nucleic acid-binding Zn-ribbon protein
MSAVLQTLKDLHQLLTELSESKDQLTRAPMQIKGKTAEFARKQQVHTDKVDALKKMKMHIHEKEVTLKGGEARVRDYKIKLNAVKTNKEYSALQDEIKNLETSNGTLEEEILGMMSEQEAASAALAESAKLLDAAKKEFDEFGQKIEYTTQKLKDRVVLLETKIKEVEETLDPAIKTEYRRMVKMKGAAALAASRDGTCQNCFTGLTAQGINDLMMNRLVHCKSCGAILYSL